MVERMRGCFFGCLSFPEEVRMGVFVAVYDGEFARLCLRRNLHQLIRPGENPLTNISTAEVEYFAARLAETTVFGSTEKFGNPWVLKDDAAELAQLSLRRAGRAALQRCELVANNLLILEGIIGRAGALQKMNPEQRALLKKRLQVAGVLYHKSSLGAFRTSSEREVLKGMAVHVPDWVRYLSYLPGNDFADLIAGGGFWQFLLS